MFGARPLARVQFAEAAVNGARRLPGELLEHDGSHERIVVCASVAEPHAARTNAFDEPGKRRIGAFQMCKRRAVVQFGHGGKDMHVPTEA